MSSISARPPVRPRRLLRPVPLLVGVVVAAGLVLFAPLSASAHVTVSATSTAAGGYTRLTFSVPTESDTENTVRVEVELPADTPFTSVRTVRVAGWSAELVTENLPEPVEGTHGTLSEAVTRVIWTADTPADAITPAETGLFVLAVGPLPDAGEIHFPALQVYDSGREVFWADQATGSAEPEHPAPSVTLTPAEEDARAGAAATVSAAGSEAAAPGADPESPWPVVTAAAALAALGVAVAALVVALRRRPISA